MMIVSPLTTTKFNLFLVNLGNDGLEVGPPPSLGGGVGGNSQVLCCLASVLSGVCMKLQSTPKCLFVFVVWNLECVCVCVCVCGGGGGWR